MNWTPIQPGFPSGKFRDYFRAPLFPISFQVMSEQTIVAEHSLYFVVHGSSWTHIIFFLFSFHFCYCPWRNIQSFLFLMESVFGNLQIRNLESWKFWVASWNERRMDSSDPNIYFNVKLLLQMLWTSSFPIWFSVGNLWNSKHLSDFQQYFAAVHIIRLHLLLLIEFSTLNCDVRSKWPPRE